MKVSPLISGSLDVYRITIKKATPVRLPIALIIIANQQNRGGGCGCHNLILCQKSCWHNYAPAG